MMPAVRIPILTAWAYLPRLRCMNMSLSPVLVALRTVISSAWGHDTNDGESRQTKRIRAIRDDCSATLVLRERPARQRLHLRLLGILRAADEEVGIGGVELHAEHAHQGAGAHPRITQHRRHQRDA